MSEEDFQSLSRLYWQLRQHRGWGSPSKATLYRKVATIKKRLLDAGVPSIEIHRVTRVLANPKSQRMQRLLEDYLRDREAGVSEWQKHV